MLHCTQSTVFGGQAEFVFVSGKCKFVLLKSAQEDFESRTLTAIPGLLGKLRYIARLYNRVGYMHWGMQKVHGGGTAEKAIRTSQGALVARVLRTPLRNLAEDLDQSATGAEITEDEVIRSLATPVEDSQAANKGKSLRPRRMVPSERHFRSVLQTLSALAQQKALASRQDASPLPPPGQ